MAKKVTGWLADDGTFFDQKAELDRYEAKRKLACLCDILEVDTEKVVGLIQRLAKSVGEYLDADKRCITKECDHDEAFPPPKPGDGLPRPEDDTSDYYEGTNDTKTLLE